MIYLLSFWLCFSLFLLIPQKFTIIFKILAVPRYTREIVSTFGSSKRSKTELDMFFVIWKINLPWSLMSRKQARPAISIKPKDFKIKRFPPGPSNHYVYIIGFKTWTLTSQKIWFYFVSMKVRWWITLFISSCKLFLFL